MTQEEKQLLLQDLSARLPYGVIVRHADCIIDDNYNETGEFHYTKGYLYDICRMDDMTTTIIESEGKREGYEHISLLERTVPYLRPMSSMTEEEKEELIKNFWGSHTAKDTFEELSWYLSKHLDINELIPKGLAIEAPEGMYD